MSTSVRIVRAVPHGPVTHSYEPVPVIATVHWYHGKIVEMDATALAWTQTAVQIEWRSHLGLRTDWLPVGHIRDPGGSNPADTPHR